jgi:hypothetical protein
MGWEDFNEHRRADLWKEQEVNLTGQQVVTLYTQWQSITSQKTRIFSKATARTSHKTIFVYLCILYARTMVAIRTRQISYSRWNPLPVINVTALCSAHSQFGISRNVSNKNWKYIMLGTAFQAFHKSSTSVYNCSVSSFVSIFFLVFYDNVPPEIC